MKQISKNPEPEEFRQWKTSKQAEIARKIAEGATGDMLFPLLPSSSPKAETGVESHHSNFTKTKLRRALLEEQGYICCYCNRALEDNHKTIIEHFKPKGLDNYKNLAFEYENLLACCDGGERDRMKPRELYCTQSKGNEDPLLPPTVLSPLDAACEASFAFDERGKIFPKKSVDSKAHHTIGILGLNAKSLVLQREKAINTYIFEIWSDNMDTKEELRLLQSKLHGKYAPFCSAIVSVLKNYP